MFLSVLDLHVTSKLGEACRYYARYIDDGLLCLNMSSMQDSSVTKVLTGRNEHIRTEPVRSLCSDHNFLDLQLGVKPATESHRAEVDYQLYRKPLNIYNYIPANSDHPRAVCKSIVHTEAIRLLRTCKKHAPYEKQCGFFASALSRRGHANGMIWNILAHYPFVEEPQFKMCDED